MNGHYLGFLIPVRRGYPLDFGGLFDAFFTHIAVAVHPEFGHHDGRGGWRRTDLCIGGLSEEKETENAAEQECVVHDVDVLSW